MAMIRLLPILMLAGCTMHVPGPETAWIHVASKHHNGGHYNEFNPGLGLEYRLTRRISVEPGFYLNSHRRPTTYGLVSFDAYRGEDLRISGAVGIADRYKGTKLEDGRAVPLAGVMVQYGWGRAFNMPGVTAFSAGIGEQTWNP